MKMNTVLSQALSGPSVTQNEGKFYIPSLDGLRAIAFILVFISHSGFGHLFRGGSFGVVIFFFLSGYLITTLLRLEAEKYGNIDFKGFYLRRIFRILPTFYSVFFLGLLVTALGLLPTTWQQLDPRAIAAHGLFFSNYWIAFQGYGGQVDGSSLFWSLAVEEHFYLLFPWLYAWMGRSRLTPRQQAMVLWGLCGLVLLWRCVLVFGFQVPEDRTYMGTDTRLDAMLFGCALAVYHNPAFAAETPQVWSHRVWKWVWLPLGLLLLGVTLVVKDMGFRETFRYTLQSIALYPCFIVAIRYPNWGIFRSLNWGWVRGIGVLSYALYVVHYLVIFAVMHQVTGLPLGVKALLALGISVAIAVAIYRWIEQPMARLRRRYRRT